MVFDTIYFNVDKLSNELIMKMFGVQKFRMEKAPKQKGDIVCGLFAIAIATALAHFGLDGAMASTSFNQCGMRDHLLICFENNPFSPTAISCILYNIMV